MNLNAISRFGALMMLMIPASALADPLTVAGTGVSISYNIDGLAFDPDAEAGIQGYVGSGPDWYDYTWYQSSSTTIEPFLASAFAYERDGASYEYSGYIKGTGASDSVVDWSTTSSTDLTGSGLVGTAYVWEMGDLVVTKTETWDEAGYGVRVHFAVTNNSSSTLENFQYMHLIDPADSSGSLNSTNTRNDLQDNDGDGVLEYAQSQGRSTSSRTNNRTISVGLCDPGAEEVNYKSGVEVLISEALDSGFDGDTDGATSDQQIIYLHSEDSVAPGETVMFAFILSVGSNDSDALDAFLAAQPGCWDLDDDGHDSTEFGGDDCDDLDDEVFGGAEETWYDGYDQDCGEDDDYDQDKDGFADAGHADEYGPTLNPADDEPIEGTGELDATDCDDEDDSVNGAAEEVWYDGYDQDCGEDDDYDQDKDGFADAEHADDYGPTRNPGTGDEIDGTGELDPTDCDDDDDEINADAEETWYDGYDQDCGEDDDYDQDKDGYADADHADDYGPTRNPGTNDEIDGTGELDATDCDDEDSDVNAGVEETWYDGVDQDCGEDDDYDADKDGVADEGHADEYGPTTEAGSGDEIEGTGELEPTDCDDTDPEVQLCDTAPDPLDFIYKGGGGCACSTSAAPVGASLGWLAAIGALVARRRRARGV